MLQSMRHLAHTWLFKGLMLILLVSFGIWGIGDMFRGNPLQRTAAKAGSVSISVQELNREFDRALVRARQSFGPELTAQQAKQLGLLNNALDGMIERAQVDQDIKRLGLAVSDKTALEQVAALPQFQKDGTFDKEKLRRGLEQNNLSEREFISEEGKDLERHQLLDTLLAGAPAPQMMTDALYKARAQKRILDIITVKNDAITGIAAPDDAVLQDYYKQNPRAFTAPEYRGITIARLSLDDLTKDVTVSDGDLKKAYDAKADQYTHPEQRDLVQVVVQDETKAKDIASAARFFHSLDTAAKKYGYDAVPLNQAVADTLLDALAKPSFSLKVNEVSAPVKTTLGWHVIEVKKIIPAGKASFDDVKDQLRAEMQKDQAIDTATKLVNQLDDELAANHPLEDIADGMKMRLVKIPALEAGGKTADGKDAGELPAAFKQDLLKAAFTQNAGETSPVLDDRNGNYFVVRTDDVTPSAAKPFDQVKDDVIKGWTAREQAKRAAEQADKIAKALREGKAPSSFAAEKDVDVRVSKPISMLGDKDAGLPDDVTPQIMSMKKGDVSVAPLGDKQIVFRLLDILETDDKADSATADKGKIASELESVMPREVMEGYIKYLRVLFPVDIKQDVIESLTQQGS